MRLVITAEHHFVTTSDGKFWGPDSMTYPFWRRYLDVFDQVSVVARVRRVDDVAPEYGRLDGPDVSVEPVPDYVGPREYLGVRRAFHQVATEAAEPADAVLLRVGCSPLAATMESTLRRRNQPYGVEVITDPFMVFAPGAIRHPLRHVFRRMFTRQLQRQCAYAAAATYVTRSALQARYPAGQGSFSTSYSDVDLPPEAFVTEARSGSLLGAIPTIVSIGSMAQLYKGFDVLIEAIAQCAKQGLVVNLVLVGDGKHRPELEHHVRRLGLQHQVVFTGQLAGGAAVREQLDHADLFVLASRTEGLPRVMLEAQARGLPCLGTDVGGIPELLDEAHLVLPNDADGLAARIMEMVGDPQRRAVASERNLALAKSFSVAALNVRRTEFLRELRDRTIAAMPPMSPSPARRGYDAERGEGWLR